MINVEYDAVRHILTAPQIAARTAAYIASDDFDFEGLEREAATMSSGEELLVRVARELWLAEKSAGLWELTRRLDAPSFRRVVESLCRSRGRAAVAEAPVVLRLAA